MGTKVAKLALERDPKLMYYIRKNEVVAVRRINPGEPKSTPVTVATIDAELDYTKYLYYLDADGDVSCRDRAPAPSDDDDD